MAGEIQDIDIARSTATVKQLRDSAKKLGFWDDYTYWCDVLRARGENPNG